MTTIEKLKQGCGKVGKIYKGIKGQYWYAACGKPYLWERDNGKNIPLNLYLCPICQAKLSQHTEDVEEFKKKIDNMPCLDKRHISHPCQEHPKIINADELKSSLDDKDEGKEIGGMK